MTTLSLHPGSVVEVEGRRGTIERVLDFDSVLVRDEGSGAVRAVRIGAVRPISDPDALPTTVPELSGVPPESWAIAQRRYDIIRPLLELGSRTRVKVTARAREFGCARTTLYSWLQRYDRERRITALLPQVRRDRGSVRLAPEVEAVIASVTEEQYLTPQKRRAAHVCRDVLRRCHRAGLPPPVLVHPRSDRVA